ncbi:MAG TPA: glycoside hydrolase family 13 [Candidatus Krumholzibacteria bacterium]|nr:glycoside hydrolase family 13 [Candidatus Krumholzibacteria bacterium]
MNTLLVRYLDGDLTEAEAAALQARLAADPALARDLRGIEAALDRFTCAAPPGPAPDFTDRVMAALPADGRRVRPRLPRWRTWAVAASLVLCIGAGWTLGRLGRPTSPPARTDLAAVAGQPAVHWVRLVYAPGDDRVRQVNVAGDFNGWDAAATPMSREDGVWTAWLALPADDYEYQFVENGGERWLPDPLAARTRDDGFGGRNAVLELGL